MKRSGKLRTRRECLRFRSSKELDTAEAAVTPDAAVVSCCGTRFAQLVNVDDCAGMQLFLARVRYTAECVYLSRAGDLTMADRRDSRSTNGNRRRAGRPPAGAKTGEKVKDYPQLSIRVPQEMKARLNAVSAVTGLAQWRVIVEAINCFVHDLSPQDRELVDGLSARLVRSSG